MSLYGRFKNILEDFRTYAGLSSTSALMLFANNLWLWLTLTDANARIKFISDFRAPTGYGNSVVSYKLKISIPDIKN